MLSRPIKFGRTGTAVMKLYDSTQLQTINDTEQYHGVIGFSVGSAINGFTFKASLVGEITNTANNGGILRCTNVAHGLDTGDYVSLNGMGDASHVGKTQVTVIDLDTFDCDDIVFNSTSDTGYWQRGSSLKVNDGYDGTYRLEYSGSWTSSGNSKIYKLEIVKNSTGLDEIVTERKIGVAGDLGSSAASGIDSLLIAGDTIWLQVECVTDSTNYTFKHSNVNISSI